MDDALIDEQKLWSVEAEAAVLGSVIIDQNCFDKVLGILPEPEAFFNKQNQIIYAALIRLFKQKAPIDAVVLRAELDKSNQLEQAGGVEYLTEVMDSVPHAANAVYYGGIVREKHHYRNLVTAVHGIQNVLAELLSVDEQIEQVQNLALDLQTVTPDENTLEFANSLEVVRKIGTGETLIKTGFPSIDNIIGGFAPGNFVLIAGRPSMGKSALAVDVSLRMAKAGKAIVFFSLEMSPQELIERTAGNIAEVNIAHLKRDGRKVLPEDRLYRRAAGMEELDICVRKNDETTERIAAFIRARKRRQRVDVVIVDYVQRMHGVGRIESKYQEMTAISRRLKSIAQQEHIVMIGCCQLNRAPEGRQSHRPRLSDLRDSGAWEQDCDFALLLHREDYYRLSENPDAKEDGLADVTVAKGRNTPTGQTQLIFDAQYVKFIDPKETIE